MKLNFKKAQEEALRKREAQKAAEAVNRIRRENPKAPEAERWCDDPGLDWKSCPPNMGL